MSLVERLGSPEDIAEVVSFLAGPARWIGIIFVHSRHVETVVVLHKT